MTTSGPRSPTAASDGGGGGQVWVNPTNVYGSNDSSASWGYSGVKTPSNNLQVTGFGFSIPTGAVIQGIAVAIERKDVRGSGGTGRSRDNHVYLTKNGTAAAGADKADGATDWPTADTVANYGGAGDLWSTTWTAAEVNASTFGVLLSGKYQTATGTQNVDYISVTVTYVLAGHVLIVDTSSAA